MQWNVLRYWSGMQGIWIICSGMAFILSFKEIDQIAEKLSRGVGGRGGGGGGGGAGGGGGGENIFI